MREKTLKDMLGGFVSVAPESGANIKSGAPVTIWLPAQAKARYDKLQASSGRQFSKKAREVLIALIDIAEARTG